MKIRIVYEATEKNRFIIIIISSSSNSSSSSSAFRFLIIFVQQCMIEKLQYNAQRNKINVIKLNCGAEHLQYTRVKYLQD